MSTAARDGGAPAAPAASAELASPSGPAPPQLIGGRYVIERELAQGGLGTVCLARHERTGHRVVIKTQQSSSPQLTAVFAREARLLANTRAPNVVHFLDYFVEGERAYLVQEYVADAVAFEAWQAGRALPELFGAYASIATTLAALHADGVVHRDLKPSNVLVRGNEPVLIDFGLAVLSTEHDALTQHGTAVGTPAYMAPEAITSDGGLGPAADVFALGVMLFEGLTGSLPEGKVANVGELLRTRTAGGSAWTSVRRIARVPGLGPARALLAEMLATAPLARPPAAAVSQRLRALAGDATLTSYAAPLATTSEKGEPAAATELPPSASTTMAPAGEPGPPQGEPGPLLQGEPQPLQGEARPPPPPVAERALAAPHASPAPHPLPTSFMAEALRRDGSTWLMSATTSSLVEASGRNGSTWLVLAAVVVVVATSALVVLGVTSPESHLLDTLTSRFGVSVLTWGLVTAAAGALATFLIRRQAKAAPIAGGSGGSGGSGDSGDSGGSGGAWNPVSEQAAQRIAAIEAHVKRTDEFTRSLAINLEQLVQDHVQNAVRASVIVALRELKPPEQRPLSDTERLLALVEKLAVGAPDAKSAPRKEPTKPLPERLSGYLGIGGALVATLGGLAGLLGSLGVWHPQAPPEIVSLTVTPPRLEAGRSAMLTVEARDPDGDALEFAYSASEGLVRPGGPTAQLTAPERPRGIAMVVLVSVTDRSTRPIHKSIAVPIDPGRVAPSPAE